MPGRESTEKGDAMNWTKKQKKIFAGGFILCVLFSGILWFWWFRAKEPLPYSFLVNSGIIRWCGQDKDCDRVKVGACGCSSGGVDESINRLFKWEWYEYWGESARRERTERGEESELTLCIAMENRDNPRCHFEEVFPACVNHQCRLKNHRTGESW